MALGRVIAQDVLDHTPDALSVAEDTALLLAEGFELGVGVSFFREDLPDIAGRVST